MATDERRKVLWLKSCPQCKGDLMLAIDAFGQYVICLQCGRIADERYNPGHGLNLSKAPPLPYKRVSGKWDKTNLD